MVKIVERTEEERNLKKKVNQLVKITNIPFLSDTIIKGLNAIIVLQKSENIINIFPKYNKIHVGNREYLDCAEKLAVEFEGHYPRPEWTVKKDYDEPSEK